MTNRRFVTGPVPKAESNRLAVNTTPEIKAEVMRIAGDRGVSISQLVNEALEMWLELQDEMEG